VAPTTPTALESPHIAGQPQLTLVAFTTAGPNKHQAATVFPPLLEPDAIALPELQLGLQQGHDFPSDITAAISIGPSTPKGATAITQSYFGLSSSDHPHLQDQQFTTKDIVLFQESRNDKASTLTLEAPKLGKAPKLCHAVQGRVRQLSSEEVFARPDLHKLKEKPQPSLGEKVAYWSSLK
jgi:hypothetical protein